MKIRHGTRHCNSKRPVKSHFLNREGKAQEVLKISQETCLFNEHNETYGIIGRCLQEYGSFQIY